MHVVGSSLVRNSKFSNVILGNGVHVGERQKNDTTYEATIEKGLLNEDQKINTQLFCLSLQTNG
jgi:hypothetical protein